MLIRFIEQNISPRIGRYILSNEGVISGETICLILSQDKNQGIDIVFH